MSGQLAGFWTSGLNRERHTASKSMRDVAALPFALPGCASICAAVLAAGMFSTVCGAVAASQSCRNMHTARPSARNPQAFPSRAVSHQPGIGGTSATALRRRACHQASMVTRNIPFHAPLCISMAMKQKQV